MKPHRLFLSASGRRAHRLATWRCVGLELLEDRTVPGVLAEVEPNDTFRTAQGVPVAAGEETTAAADDWLTIRGAVATGSDADFYSFTLGAASVLLFDLDARVPG